MAFCDVCGEKLDEKEKERRIGEKQVCHDCLYDGLELLRETVGDLKKDGREKLEARLKAEREKKAAEEEQERLEKEEKQRQSDSKEG